MKLSGTYKYIIMYVILVFVELFIIGPGAVLFKQIKILSFIQETSTLTVSALGVILTSYFLKEKIKYDSDKKFKYTDVGWLMVGRSVVTFLIVIIMLILTIIGWVLALFTPLKLGNYFSSISVGIIVYLAEILSIFVLHKTFNYKYGGVDMSNLSAKVEVNETSVNDIVEKITPIIDKAIKVEQVTKTNKTNKEQKKPKSKIASKALADAFNSIKYYK